MTRSDGCDARAVPCAPPPASPGCTATTSFGVIRSRTYISTVSRRRRAARRDCTHESACRMALAVASRGDDEPRRPASGRRACRKCGCRELRLSGSGAGLVGVAGRAGPAGGAPVVPQRSGLYQLRRAVPHPLARSSACRRPCATAAEGVRSSFWWTYPRRRGHGRRGRQVRR